MSEIDVTEDDRYDTCLIGDFRTDSLDGLKRALPRIDKELSEPSKFKDLYQFTFNFAKNPEQKGLGMFLGISLHMKMFC